MLANWGRGKWVKWFIGLWVVGSLVLAASGCTTADQSMPTADMMEPAPGKRDEVLRLLQSSRLSRVSRDIEKNLRYSIRLRPVPNLGGNQVQAGLSKLGGLPDLPAGVAWPATPQGRPLNFLAQVNLAEVTGFDVDKLLPDKGLLYFFYDAEEQVWGDIDQAGGWKVIYDQGGEELAPRSAPGTLQVFPEYSLKPFLEVTLPASDAPGMPSLSWGESDRYLDLQEKVALLYGDENEPIHRLLGNPDDIQGDMRVEAELHSRGLEWTLEASAAAEEAAKDWVLLFQVDSDEQADDQGMMWGDAGRVYFLIKQDDLRSLNFDRVWVIMQCY